MTRNAGRGPQQPCGKVLLRTDHGWYRVLAADELEELAAAPAHEPTPWPAEVIELPSATAAGRPAASQRRQPAVR